MRNKLAPLSIALIFTLCACSKNSTITPQEAVVVADYILSCHEHPFDYFLTTYNLEHWNETVSIEENTVESEMINISYSQYKNYFSVQQKNKVYNLDSSSEEPIKEYDFRMWFYLLNEKDVYYVTEDKTFTNSSSSSEIEKSESSSESSIEELDSSENSSSDLDSSSEEESPYEVSIKTFESRDEAIEYFNSNYIVGINNFIDLFLSTGSLKYIKETVNIVSDKNTSSSENMTLSQHYESQMEDHLVYNIEYEESTTVADDITRISHRSLSGTYINNISRYYNEIKTITTIIDGQSTQILKVKNHTNIDPYSVKVNIPVK